MLCQESPDLTLELRSENRRHLVGRILQIVADDHLDRVDMRVDQGKRQRQAITRVVGQLAQGGRNPGHQRKVERRRLSFKVVSGAVEIAERFDVARLAQNAVVEV